MRIIFVGTLPPIIGLSPYCLHLSNALSKKIDLEFISFKRFANKSLSFKRETKISEEYYNDILKRIKIQKLLTWNSPLSGFKVGLQLKGDILHVQWWISQLILVYLPIVLIAKMKNIKIVFSIHNILPHEKNKKNVFLDKVANRFIFPFVDAFIVHNKRNKRQFVEIYGINERKVFIVTHGVLDLVKKTDIPMEVARRHLHLPSRKKIVLFFGYIRPYKGVDVLIKAFVSVKKQVKNAFLLISGQILNDTWDKYKKLIKENNLKEDDIRVDLGFVPEEEVGYYFSAADVVVLPYKHLDTHGGVGALALSFKKPVLVTDVGGLPEFIKDTRVLVKPSDIRDLSEKLTKVLKDEQLCLKLQSDSERLSREITWDRIADETIKIYHSLMGEGRDNGLTSNSFKLNFSKRE